MSMMQSFEETDGNAQLQRHIDLRRSVLDGDCIEDDDVGTQTIFENTDTDCDGVTIPQRQHLTKEELISKQNYDGAVPTLLWNLPLAITLSLAVVILSVTRS
eukprot:gb/GECG01003644.1/.p1 GENE.gb/GECG01003644.1/~~gb/GECG01003644.1/.p1  ORF type:complete len:102 (+),score=12.75 gb/GECG01003644.1/:1-306(+)